jgi:hypothetical protein
MWNDKPDGYPIPARNPTGTGTGMNFYRWVWVRVQISTRSLFAGGWVITLPDPNSTRYHPYGVVAMFLHKGVSKDNFYESSYGSHCNLQTYYFLTP